MRASSDLHRSLSRITLDVHRQIQARQKAAAHYALCEREQQFQHPISGTVGSFPAEATFKVLFDISFLGDAGVARDSQLDEPLVRVGHHFSSAPPGTIVYGYVSTWVRDDDFNFVGAHVTVGVHNPRVEMEGAGATRSREFAGTVHLSFQGFGAPIDPDGDGAGGGGVGQ